MIHIDEVIPATGREEARVQCRSMRQQAGGAGTQAGTALYTRAAQRAAMAYARRGQNIQE